MSVIPKKLGTFNFKKCDLLNDRLLLGIDSGSSTTKIVFLHKDNEAQLHDDQLDSVTFHQVLFNNSDFEEALKWVHERYYKPTNDYWTLHLTGVSANNKKPMMESIFGFKTNYVDEMLTIAAGHRIGLEQIGLEQLISTDVDVESYGNIESNFLDKVVNAFKSRYSMEKSSEAKNDTEIFPCLIHAYGSASGFFYFDERGVGEFASNLLMGGKTFMGLAKCLLDTNNFEEIVELASRGNRGNVDTQAKELLQGDTNSPYGKYPPDMPIFQFGKCADYDIGKEILAKEDLAMSLVALFAFTMVMQCGQIAMIKKTSRIYLTGNIFRSDLFKKEIQRILMLYQFIPCLEVLDFGYFGAFGAMMCNDDDKEKYYKD